MVWVATLMRVPVERMRFWSHVQRCHGRSAAARFGAVQGRIGHETGGFPAVSDPGAGRDRHANVSAASDRIGSWTCEDLLRQLSGAPRFGCSWAGRLATRGRERRPLPVPMKLKGRNANRCPSPKDRKATPRRSRDARYHQEEHRLPALLSCACTSAAQHGSVTLLSTLPPPSAYLTSNDGMAPTTTATDSTRAFDGVTWRNCRSGVRWNLDNATLEAGTQEGAGHVRKYFSHGQFS